MLRFYWALVMCLGIAACGPTERLKKMDENTQEMNETTKQMNGSTHEMAKTTQKMNQTTSDMAKTTNNMAEITKNMKQGTDELMDLQKMGGTADQRQKNFEALKAARSAGLKLAHAGNYFMAFEYQLWSGIGQDHEERRNELRTLATQEFFKAAKEFLVQQPIEPFARGGKDDQHNLQAAFNALAAALHKINRKSEDVERQLQVHPDSMFSLIETALLAKASIEDHSKNLSDYPPYVKEILVQEALAVRLLQARHNFIGVIFLSEASHLTEVGLLNTPTEYCAMSRERWDLNYDEFNQAQLERYKEYLTSAIATQNLLRKAGYTPTLDKDLIEIFRNVRPVSAQGGTVAEVTLHMQIHSLMEEYTSNRMTEIPRASGVAAFARNAGKNSLCWALNLF